MKQTIALVGLILGLVSLACSPLGRFLATATPTPTDTPAPTRTLSRTPTLTPTPTETALPRATATPQPRALLTLDDLPRGFEDLADEELFDQQANPFMEGVPVESTFAFLESNRFEFILGISLSLDSAVDRSGFDASMRRPELVAEYMTGSLQDQGFGDITVVELPGLEGFGDSSVGLTMLLGGDDPFELRMDMVMLRVADRGAVLALMYLDGEQPSLPIDELAGLAVAKIDSGP